MPIANNLFLNLFSCLLLLIAGPGCDKDTSTQPQEQGVETNPSAAEPPPLPVRPSLLSKDPEYWTYRAPVLECHDQMSEEFLQLYSPKWVARSQDIDAQIAQIIDPGLKQAQKTKLQAELDPSLFRTEAIKAYELAAREYNEKRATYFNSHMDQWFEIAQYSSFSPSDQNILFAKSAEAPYIVESLNLKLEIPTMDIVFRKFKAELQHDIDATANSKWQYILSKVDPNEFYAGYSQPEIDDMVAKEKQKVWDEAEQDFRKSRLMLVAQGDVLKKNFTRLALMNQINADVLYEFPPEAIKKMRSQLPR